VASIFSLGHLSEVIGSLIATRVLIQYLPQTVGFFLLRFKSPQLARPFRMWFYPLPGIISIVGWLYVLGTAARKSLLFALAVFAVGSAAYFIRSRMRHEWPFTRQAPGG
jgi:amino acid transporter